MLSFFDSSAQLQPTKLPAGQLLIRRMREVDIPGIMEIEAVSFGRHHWSEESFLNELKNNIGRYYTLLQRPASQGVSSNPDKEKVMGYCGYWLIIDEAHVTTIAVHPEYRGNSLGELLVLHILERCMGQSVQWVTLEVRVTNFSAQSLYYRNGFKSMGTRPKYYQDNQEDALIMTTPNILAEKYRHHFKERKKILQSRLSGLPEGFGK